MALLMAFFLEVTNVSCGKVDKMGHLFFLFNASHLISSNDISSVVAFTTHVRGNCYYCMLLRLVLNGMDETRRKYYLRRLLISSMLNYTIH